MGQETREDVHIERVKVNGWQKRHQPHRHYVYILQVKWSDGSDYVIYRRYKDFIVFHKKLLRMFPLEAGFPESRTRTLPHLPADSMFPLTEAKLLGKRSVCILTYCQHLVKMDTKISQCHHVVSFFSSNDSDTLPPLPTSKRNAGQKTKKETKKNPEDLEISSPVTFESHQVLADFTPEDTQVEVGLVKGSTVEVITKHELGWWFVQKEDGEQGWAPSSYLSPCHTHNSTATQEPLKTEFSKYRSRQPYTAAHEDEVTFPQGALVDVLCQTPHGWWIVHYDGRIGYVPASYLELYSNPDFRASVRKLPSHNLRNLLNYKREDCRTEDLGYTNRALVIEDENGAPSEDESQSTHL